MEQQNQNKTAVWCLDATAIADFDSIDEAMRAWHEIEDGIMVKIGDHEELWVDKYQIGIMSEEHFNSL